MKYLYIVDYFIPPSQSDGGILNVIAENDRECFDLICDWDQEEWPEYYGKLNENIGKASKFALVDEEQSRIVGEFTA